MTKMQTITPDDSRYTRLNAVVNRQGRSRIDYVLLADEYNDAPVDSLILIKAGPSTKASNVSKVLTNRGLIKNHDYIIHRINEDEDGNLLPKESRQLALKKLTTTTFLKT